MNREPLNPNCLITRTLRIAPYARCRACGGSVWGCLGMQYNVAVLVVFSAAMMLLLTESHAIHRLGVLVLLTVVLLLGGSINRHTNRMVLSARRLEEEVANNRDLAHRLQQTAGFLQNLLDSASLAIVALDTEGRVTHWNKGAERLLGYPAEETVGRPCPAILHAQGASGEEALRSLAQGVLQDGVLEEERELVAKDGTRFPVILTVTPLREPTGRGLGFLAVARDIRQQKALEAQVLQSERLSAIGQLAAGVAHELNNALTPILAYSELLAQDLQGEDRDRVDTVYKAALRAKHIADGLLRFSRTTPTQRVALAPNTVVEEALDILRYRLETEGIRVETELAPDLPVIFGDAQQLHQVFINILNNARDALEGRPAPRIRIRTYRDEGGVAIALENNGPEIPEAVRERLFDPFFTTKEVGKGTGLGLSVSYGIVREHGGRIHVESGPESTVFTLWFPATREAAPPARDAGAAAASPGLPSGLRILLVDDEPAVLDLLESVFRNTGNWLDIAHNGLEALGLMANGRYDVILSDLRMPGLGGEELHEWMSRNRPDLLERTVYLTGDAVTPGTQAFLERAGRPYLLKPFHIADLLRLVRELAAGKAGGDAPA